VGEQVADPLLHESLHRKTPLALRRYRSRKNLSRTGLRYNENASGPSAQTERRGLAGPVRACLAAELTGRMAPPPTWQPHQADGNVIPTSLGAGHFSLTADPFDPDVVYVGGQDADSSPFLTLYALDSGGLEQLFAGGRALPTSLAGPSWAVATVAGPPSIPTAPGIISATRTSGAKT
jgi:hypothetical protein